MKELSDLFLEELVDIYGAEKQLLQALPKFAEAADSDDLRAAFESHLNETEDHVDRLEQVFELMGESPRAEECQAMTGLIQEATDILEEHEDEPTLDAALICAAQKIEHYEIATYGCLYTWAELLNEEEGMELLEETLTEEKNCDDQLTEIARTANREAEDVEEESEVESDNDEEKAF